MRIASLADPRRWLILAMVIAACGQPPDQRGVTPKTPSTITARAENGATRLEIRTSAGTHYQVLVARDSTVAPTSAPLRTELIGEIPGVAFVLTDTYQSIPGGMSLCQAGEEQFLRVISVTHDPPRETLHLKTASCRDNIELATPGIEWRADSSIVRVHWLTGPKGGAEVRSIPIGRDGEPTALRARAPADSTPA